jgi:ATP-dependent helicase/nuclease subunit A
MIVMDNTEADVGAATSIDPERPFTPEQTIAIERREGDLLLDAGAGSGKTSVLVERFVRSVLEDGIDVSAILAITFTEKAAAELRERVRERFRQLGAADAARATEGAFISTIHGFCARVLRSGAIAAGLDPAFVVLDQAEAELLADAAFSDAIEALAGEVEGGVELIAAYTPPALRAAIAQVHAELRSRGQGHPALPPVPAAPELEDVRAELVRAAARAADELGAIADPSPKIQHAIDRLALRDDVLSLTDPWPGELDRIALPGGNGHALATPVCQAYGEALARWRGICEHRRAERAYGRLDWLLRRFSERYEARKRARSGVDFDDLELLARRLLAGGELRERYRQRFERVMVDEMQDTNRVQLDLIELVADGNLFTVGDAQQSIYGFRHADVELFERRGERLGAVGARATLQTNFRSRPEILEAINRAFTVVLGEQFRPLRPGRVVDRAADPRVEMLIVDKGADWAPEGLASPWRVAEARALARRLSSLIADGARAGEIVVLTRATTDLRVYERALEDAGIPTYVIGGRGYWAHPQVIEIVAYLRALANPRDEEALLTVLVSPLVGIDLGALVSLTAAARAAGRDPWWLLSDSEDRLAELDVQTLTRLREFAAWFADERRLAPRLGVEELIERAIEWTGYDLAVLGMAGGTRRLANVRKLMRLGREHELSAGRDLRGFIELARRRAEGTAGAADSRESEAPVESETLDAVRLMTIHRAKGLEFPIVCVADLGRSPIRRADLIRLSRDGRRLGLRLSEAGTGKAEPALDYVALGDDRAAAENAEERRLFYVAMTRSRERLILSGAANLAVIGRGPTPIAWIAPAFVADIAERVELGAGVSEEGVAYAFVRPDDEKRVAAASPGEALTPDPPAPRLHPAPAPPPAPPAPPLDPAPAPPPAPPATTRSPPVAALSYSALAEYERCGYRFYAERVLGLRPSDEAAEDRAEPESGLAAEDWSALQGAERGVLIHGLLERLDFRRPQPPSAETVLRAAAEHRPSRVEAEEIAAMLVRFAGSETCRRLARAGDVRREERFAFALSGGVLFSGVLDVVARERGGGLVVVDYKSDRLGASEPASRMGRAYTTQRLIYAVAALRAGVPSVEVAHLFLERPEAPVRAVFTQDDAARLGAELEARAGGVLQRRFPVADAPVRSLCRGCPAEGGLCSWPLAMTRREAIDQLF